MAEAAESEGSSEEHESLEDKVADKAASKETGKREYGLGKNASVDSKVISLSKYKSMKLAKPHNSSHSSEGGHSEHNRKEKADDVHGAVAIIYFEDPETGYVEAVFEPRSDKRANGDLSLIGGTRSFYDDDARSNLLRETKEEVGDKKAAEAIVNALRENGTIYHIHQAYWEGKNASTHIYAIKITDKKEWEAVKHTPLIDGHHHEHAKTLSLDEIMKGNHKFAYGFGPVIKSFFLENYGNNYRYGLGKSNPSDSGAHHYSIDSVVAYKPVVSQAKPYSDSGTVGPAKLSYIPAGYQVFKAA